MAYFLFLLITYNHLPMSMLMHSILLKQCFSTIGLLHPNSWFNIMAVLVMNRKKIWVFTMVEQIVIAVIIGHKSRYKCGRLTAQRCRWCRWWCWVLSYRTWLKNNTNIIYAHKHHESKLIQDACNRIYFDK